MKFNELKLIEPLLKALESEGYETPTPIQEQAIPSVLEGRDLLGIAQTGTGKTAAFSLPLLQHMWTVKKFPSRGMPRALILAPTRELAAQIDASISAYGKNLRITHAVIFGGVGQQPQVNALQRGIDILVATPGRLLDLMQQGYVRLDLIEIFILDEADRMLDMGFIHDVRKIITRLPPKRQNLFFSATMPDEVTKLGSSILTNPVRVEVTPPATTVERIAQHVLFVDKQNKDQLLLDLLAQKHLERVLVFSRTKHGANKIAARLVAARIPSAAIHGNKSQTARMLALSDFKTGRVRVLVATDIAARGIDIDDISHVINYDLPNEPESYVHRIGRTARAGADGAAYSFCSAQERNFLRDIERLTRQHIPVMEHPYHSDAAKNATGRDAEPEPRKPFVRHGGGGRRFGGPRRSGHGGHGGTTPRRHSGSHGGSRSNSSSSRGGSHGHRFRR